MQVAGIPTSWPRDVYWQSATLQPHVGRVQRVLAFSFKSINRFLGGLISGNTARSIGDSQLMSSMTSGMT